MPSEDLMRLVRGYGAAQRSLARELGSIAIELTTSQGRAQSPHSRVTSDVAAAASVTTPTRRSYNWFDDLSDQLEELHAEELRHSGQRPTGVSRRRVPLVHVEVVDEGDPRHLPHASSGFSSSTDADVDRGAASSSAGADT